MLKYLILHLDDTSVSFCHYTNTNYESKLINIETLKKALLWSMKENLSVQVVYPDYELPMDYKHILCNIDHTNVVSSKNRDCLLRKNADVVVFNSIPELIGYSYINEQAYIIRTSLENLFEDYGIICENFQMMSRINIIITDVHKFDQEAQLEYKNVLSKLSDIAAINYKKGQYIQLNILTDILFLDKMNNCNAGVEHVTVAPDGNFYVCPAFYLDSHDSKALGSLASGLDIKNPQLYKREYAPICRLCDANQCKRCIWLNRKMTLEVNTPSHEQCVMAHMERNQSRELIADIRKFGVFMPEKKIPSLDYLDPFDKILEKK